MSLVTFLRRQSLKWSPRHYPVRLDASREGGELGPYYVSLQSKLPRTLEQVRAAPVVMLDEPSNGVPFLHPVATSHRALALYEKWWDTGAIEYRAAFFSVARALYDGGTLTSNAGRLWLYPEGYGVSSTVPWKSAMAQGLCLAVAARAAAIANSDCDRRFFVESAAEAFEPFKWPISQGGVVADDEEFSCFFEEYAVLEKEKQYHTLNGMMAALFGLRDYAEACGSSEGSAIFDSGMKRLKDKLLLYDFPFCSAYDLRHVVGSIRPLLNARYHAVHVAHLQVLAHLGGDNYFRGVSDCWSRKLMDPVNRFRMFGSYCRWKAVAVLAGER